MFAFRCAARRFVSTAATADECGIPFRSTWSVNELLSSYPKPALSNDALVRLHNLSALIPPKEGTPEFKQLKADMEDMVKLVEAVKLVDTAGIEVKHGIEHTFSAAQNSLPNTEPSGHSLMKHAARTKDGFYVVELDRQR